MDAERPIAAIDIGSNSVYLTLARVHGNRIEYLERVKDPARLAGEIQPNGHLGEAAVERLIATLRRFAATADTHDAEVRATATAAVRSARNADDLLRRLEEEVGVRVELLSGADEGRLTFVGASHGLAEIRDGVALCVDIGGGSTELVCGREGRPLLSASIAVGSLVTARRWLGPDPVGRGAVRRARRELTSRLDVSPFHQLEFTHAVATAGSVQRAVRVARALEGRALPNLNVHRQVLTAADVDRVASALIRAPNRSDRLLIPGMDPERADSLLGGVLILQTLTRALQVKSWTVSMSALRVGVLIDTQRRRLTGLHR